MPTRISYDGMSRLTAAGYLENGKRNDHFSTSYKYDIMGNILTLRREGLLDSGDYGTIDDLTYSYEGKQTRLTAQKNATPPQRYADVRCRVVALLYI